MLDSSRYDDYRYYLATHGNRRATSKTIAEHIGFFKRLHRAVDTCTAQAVKKYLGELYLSGNCKGQTVNHYISILRTWDKCFGESEYGGLEFYPEEDPNVEPFRREEFEQFIAVKNDGKGQDKRAWYTYTMFWKIAGYCGMRLGEVSRLRVEQVDFGLNCFILKSRDTKTNKKRHPPISPFICDELKAYIGERKTGLLFTTRNGGPLHTAAWGNNFRHRLAILGINRDGLTANSVRHTYITRNVSKMGLFETQRIVGHKLVSTTEKYMHLDDEPVQQATFKDPWVQDVIEPQLVVENFKPHVLNLRGNKKLDVEVVDNPREYVVRITWWAWKITT